MSATPRADLWFSALLTAFGIAVVVQSWRMPRLQDLGVHPMSAPGLTPGVIGAVLTGLGIALLIRSIRASIAARAPEGGADWIGSGRLLGTLLLCLVFGGVLLGRLPFGPATALFVFAFVTAFKWREGRPARTLAAAGGLAIAVAVAVTLLFERVFLIRLP